MSMDISEISALLHIEEGTRHQPQLKAIHDAALLKLIEHNNTHVQAAKSEEVPPTAGPLTLGAAQENFDDAENDPNEEQVDIEGDNDEPPMGQPSKAKNDPTPSVGRRM